MKAKKPLYFSVAALKNVIVPVAAIAFLFSSCKKSSDQPAFHVTGNVNGVATSFNAQSIGHIEYDGGNKSVTINGLTALSATAGNLGFVITNLPSSDSISAGVYADTTTRFEVLASYSGNISGSDAYEAGTSFYQEAVNNGVTLANHFTATITAITSTTIKGTFSGDFYLNGDAGGEKKSITNGDFYVKIQ